MARSKDSDLLNSQLIHRLEPLSLRARLVVEGFMTGMHRSPYHGFSVEFAEHRMYQPGDALKHIDWKVWGRTDRFYIKQYQEETNLRSHILLDLSASMGFSSDDRVSKAEYGKSLAAALIYLLLSQRDAVGLGLFDTGLRELYPPKSALTWRQVLWSAIENAAVSGETEIGDVLHTMAERIKRRGLVIIISDLFDDPDKIIKGLQHFRHSNQEVLVFQILDPREIDFAFDREARFEELETGKKLVANPWQVKESYKHEMDAFLNEIRSGCGLHLVDHHLLTTSTPLEDALMAFLTKRKLNH